MFAIELNDITVDSPVTEKQMEYQENVIGS